MKADIVIGTVFPDLLPPLSERPPADTWQHPLAGATRPGSVHEIE
jgi:hypothetical protein